MRLPDACGGSANMEEGLAEAPSSPLRCRGHSHERESSLSALLALVPLALPPASLAAPPSAESPAAASGPASCPSLQDLVTAAADEDVTRDFAKDSAAAAPAACRALPPASSPPLLMLKSPLAARRNTWSSESKGRPPPKLTAAASSSSGMRRPARDGGVLLSPLPWRRSRTDGRSGEPARELLALDSREKGLSEGLSPLHGYRMQGFSAGAVA